MLVAPAATPAAPRPTPQPAVARAAAPASVSASGHGPSGLRIAISMVVLLVSGLLLLGFMLTALPAEWVREMFGRSVIVQIIRQGAALLAWLGFAATLINCARLAQAGGWRKSVVLWAAILLALTDLFYRAYHISAYALVFLTNSLAVNPVLPWFLSDVFILLKPLAVVALSLILSGWHRWAVLAIGITALFASAAASGIQIAMQMKVLDFRIIQLHWVNVLCLDVGYLLCFAAAVVCLLAVLRNPGQATSTPASPTPASAPQRGGGGGCAKAPTNHILYVVLGLFFGCLGVHNFLAGYTRKAVVQLLISFTVIGLCVTTIWALVDICTVKEDADGVPFT